MRKFYKSPEQLIKPVKAKLRNYYAEFLNHEVLKMGMMDEVENQSDIKHDPTDSETFGKLDSEDGNFKGSFDSLEEHVKLKDSGMIFEILPEEERTGESDPSGKGAHDAGAKLDAGKPQVDLMFQGFPRALLAVSEVTTHGAIKYTPLGFLEVDNGQQRYADAGGRHMLKRFIEGEIDSELPVYHLAQKAWNVLAELEFMCKRLDYPNKNMVDSIETE